MITKQVINTLYKKYRKLPESPDCLDMPLLFDYASTHHNISIDMEGPVDALIIRSIDPASPFHRIPLERIHAIVPFENWVAIMLHSSMYIGVPGLASAHFFVFSGRGRSL